MREKTNASLETPVKIALWGLGGIYRTYEGMLRNMQEKGDIEIVAVADSNPQKAVPSDGVSIVHPCELAEFNFQYMLVMSHNQAGEILHQASVDYGIDSERLLTYEILKVPRFDFPRYAALRAVFPSIISNSSWATSVCRILQMNARSPLVGTRIREHDYLKLLTSLDDYMAEPSLVFRGWRFDAYGRRYLAALAGDIGLRFFEPHTEVSATATWREGCTLLNRQFIIAQMSTLDPECEKQFDALTGFARKICFVPYKTERTSSLQVPVGSGHHVFELSVERTIEQELDEAPYDVLDLLLGQGDIRERHIG